jgi:hypothetical protein
MSDDESVAVAITTYTKAVLSGLPPRRVKTMPRFSVAGWRSSPWPWVWPQLTLRHYTVVGLSDAFYLIFKFTFAHRNLFTTT